MESAGLRSLKVIQDSAVQETNDDAQLSKLACVRLGYFQDAFVHFFVKKLARRAPLINRGYYSRYAALRTMLFQFLAAGACSPDGMPRKQVLCLGAGYDTTFFQLAHEGLIPDRLAYIEVDFRDIAKRKATAIARTPELMACISPGGGSAAVGREGGGVEIDVERGRVSSRRYHLEAADLRDIDTLETALQRAELDPSVPTFVLAECVLVYMEPSASASLVRWLGERLQTAAFVVYEQLNPSDAFGRQMMVNLQSRGVQLLGIRPSLQAHAERFTGAGWQRADAKSMSEVYRQSIDPVDRRRIERLEIFDEFEEWDLIQGHYCIAFGVNDASGLLKDYAFPVFAPPQGPQLRAPEPAARQNVLPS